MQEFGFQCSINSTVSTVSYTYSENQLRLDQPGKIPCFFFGSRMFQAAKKADKDNHAGGFDVSLLNEFMGLAVDIGAFDHIR